MNKSFKILLSSLMLLMVTVLSYAQVPDFNSEQGHGPGSGPDFAERQQKGKEVKQKEDKNKRVDIKKMLTYTVPVYMFSISAQFGDSIVYITNVQEVSNIRLTKKYDYLYFRSEYSNQFTKFLNNNYKTDNQTTGIFFSKNKNKFMKRYNKILKKYEQNRSIRIVIVPDDKFQFKAVEDSSDAVS